MALSSINDRNKRRRRRRSTQALAQTQPVGVSRRPIQTSYMEIFASVGIAVAAIALIALIWITVVRSGENYRSVLQARVEATVSGQAQILATEVRREMLNVAQSLNILKRAYQADPDHFDLQAWQAQMPALTDISGEIFIADNELVIEQDSNKASVGLGVGANISDLSNNVTERSTRTDDLIVGPAIDRVKERQHVALMFVPLEKPGGWYVGATYKTDALSRLYSEASLGVQGMVALINTRMGRIEIISGPAADNPTFDIAGSAMYQAMKIKPNGAWVGPSAPDGIERINGFHQVPGRELAVVVAVDRHEALEQSETWVGSARGLAWAGTFVVLLAAALLLYGAWTVPDHEAPPPDDRSGTRCPRQRAGGVVRHPLAVGDPERPGACAVRRCGRGGAGARFPATCHRVERALPGIVRKCATGPAGRPAARRTPTKPGEGRSVRSAGRH